MPAVRLSEARLEASDVGALVREAHSRGGGLLGHGQNGRPRQTPSPLGASAAWGGGGVPGRGVR